MLCVDCVLVGGEEPQTVWVLSTREEGLAAFVVLWQADVRAGHVYPYVLLWYGWRAGRQRCHRSFGSLAAAVEAAARMIKLWEG